MISETYYLLDFGGNIEKEKFMNEFEAKKENENLEKQERFLRWATKESFVEMCESEPCPISPVNRIKTFK